MASHASKFRHLLLMGAALWAASTVARETESLQRLEDAARVFAQQRLPAPGPQQRLVIGPLDERLQLARCPQELSVQAGPGTVLRDRLLVEISCKAAPVWRTYIPVRIAGLGHAVALKRPMMPGQPLSAADLTIVEGDAAQFPLGFFEDPAQVTGATLRRATGGGMVLSNQMLLSSGTIVRGQAVTLLASAGGVAVRMNGRAMSDGGINQRIRVRNESSGKIVEGIARSQQLVEINP